MSEEIAERHVFRLTRGPGADDAELTIDGTPQRIVSLKVTRDMTTVVYEDAALNVSGADPFGAWADDGTDDDGERDTARRMDALDEAARLEAGL